MTCPYKNCPRKGCGSYHDECREYKKWRIKHDYAKLKEREEAKKNEL